MSKVDFGRRNWLILILFGLIGQIAWSVENMYFNLFVFDTISPDLETVTLMVQLSGIAATLTTLIAGTLSDKLGERRKFISFGYLIWGVVVGLFGFISVENMEKLFNLPTLQATTLALAVVVVGDCVMTLFGSAAYDAAFNAWVTDNTKESFRGKVEGVLSVLPLIAMLIVAGGFGILVGFVGYTGLFFGLGAVVFVCGLLGIFVVKDSPNLEKKGSLKDIVYGFNPKVIKGNPQLYLTLILMGIYGVAFQIFMPYLIIYMTTYLNFSVIEYSVVFGGAIILGAIINIFLGNLSDKLDKAKLLYIATSVMIVGLIGMYFARFESHVSTLIVFGVAGFIMITGYIFVSALCGALVRDNTPQQNAGKLQGVRMIFSVLLPMLFGPMIGNGINKLRNIPLPDLSSADAMTTKYIPAPEIFLVGAIFSMFMFVFIPLLTHINKKKKGGKKILKTDYEVGEIPLSEHPMPQAEREHWLCLNGKWSFRKLDVQGACGYDGEILVPFSPETLNSGIEEGFLLRSGETLIYSRKVDVSEDLLQGTTLLHFGAVDSECEVFWNDIKVGAHKGGFTAFTCDITSAVCAGENLLKVVCKDEATRNEGARGKQSDKAGGIWYTAQSGIWQTVWLESMPKDKIGQFKITPNAENKTVLISDVGSLETEITVFDGEGIIIQKKFQGQITLEYNFELWTPNNPKLYYFTLKNSAGDFVKSYFGVRSYGKIHDKQGIARLALNGKPFFFNGVLDQGYWSDGMLTYPTDEAVYRELKTLKDMGFNMLRKHIKIEPMRWYYYCDVLGISVWQDFVNGGGAYNFMHIAALPFLGVKHKDSDYKYFSRQSAGGREEYKTLVDETISQLYNCTCIAVWVPFNEGWGQFDSAHWTEYVREKDGTRIIDSVSGWYDQGEDKTELLSLHTYYTPLKVPKDSRPVVLSEFGGYSMKTEGHVFNEYKEFGYKKFRSEKDLVQALEKLYLEALLPLIEKGLCAAVYTQVSDVEEEINGFFTYDRKVLKVPVEKMAEINQKIEETANKIQ